MAPVNNNRRVHVIVDTGLPDDLVEIDKNKVLAFKIADERFASFLVHNDIRQWEYKIIEKSLIGRCVDLHISLKNRMPVSKMYKPLDLEIVE